jgi:organic radical activating enzyme
LEDLPLVSTGCDSYPAWDPKFKRFSKWYSVQEMAELIHSKLPSDGWGDIHLVITGGEPLLGWQSKYKELLSHPLMIDCQNITFETNATQLLTDELKQFLLWRFSPNNVFFSMSAKLPHSGHNFDEACIPTAVASYKIFDCAFKFVVKDADDIDDVKEMIDRYGPQINGIPIYIMSVGGTLEEHNKYKTEVANAALVEGWRYSDRLHVQLYGNTWSV